MLMPPLSVTTKSWARNFGTKPAATMLQAWPMTQPVEIFVQMPSCVVADEGADEHLAAIHRLAVDGHVHGAVGVFRSLPTVSAPRLTHSPT